MTTSALMDVKYAVDFGFGVDTTTDPKLIIKSRLSRLENARINKSRQIDKRNGTVSLPNVDTGGLTISSAQAIAQANDELLELGLGGLYSYNFKSGASFSRKGQATLVGVNRRIVQSNLANLQSAISASVNGITVYAYDSVATGSVYWMVVDEQSGTVYQSGSSVGAQTPQLVVVNGTIVLLYGTASGHVVGRIFTAAAPWQSPTIVSLTGITISGTMVIGAATDGTATIMVAGTNNAGGITVATYSAALAFIASVAITPGFGPPFISITHFPVVSSGCNWGLAYPDLVGNLGASFLSTNLGTVFSYGGLISGTSANPVGPACMRQSPSNSDEILVYATVYNPQGPLQLFTTPCGQKVQAFGVRISTGGRYTPLFPGDNLMLGAQLASFPWASGVGAQACIAVQYQVDPTVAAQFPASQAPLSLQPTLMILDADTGLLVSGSVPGEAMVPSTGLASATASYQVLPQAQALGSNRFQLGIGASLVLESQDAKFVYGQGVGELLFDFGLARAIFMEQLANDSHITAGLLTRYDGQTVAEHGFTLAPEFIQVTGNGTSLIDIQFSPPTVANPVTVTTLTFPPGSQMYPGEWWALDGQPVVPGSGGGLGSKSPTRYVWYNINNLGTDPAPLPFNVPTTYGFEVFILSTDTSLQVAQKTCTALQIYLQAGTTIVPYGLAVTTQNGNAVLEIQYSSPYPAGGVGLAPVKTVAAGRFSIWETIPANNGVVTNARTYSVACCPGAFIQPQQYWQFNVGGANTIVGESFVAYVWYNVNGVGTDPRINLLLPTAAGAPYAVTVGIQVNILSGDSAFLVAQKTLAAINLSPLSAYVLTENQIGNFLYLSLLTNSAAGLPDMLVPEIGANVSVGAGALGLAQGAGTNTTSSYELLGVYAEVDARGNIHRSAPSQNPTVVVCPRSPISDTRLAVTIPYLHMTSKQNAIVEYYRTAANGTTPYKQTSSLSPIANNPAALTMTILDSLQDSRAPGDTISPELVTNEILYTFGGSLQHDVLAPCSIAHVHRGRLWAAGFADDPFRCQASIQEPQGRGIAFSNDQSHILELSPDGGVVTAYAELDEKLIIFKETQVYWTFGDGPDATGQNGSFLIPEIISSEYGCIAPKAIQKINGGLMFRSAKGMCFLDRALQITHKTEADGYNGLTVTSATARDGDEHVLFTTLQGPTIVYNYLYDAWWIDDSPAAVDSLVYAPHVPGQTAPRVYCYLTPDGVVHQENPGSYYDDAVGVARLLQTAWLKPGEMDEGFARVRSALWLGDWVGDAAGAQYEQLTIEVSYSQPNATTYTTTQTFNLTGVPNGSFWGDGASWGADASWGGPALLGQDVYQWLSHLKVQKVEAVRFTLQEIAPIHPTRASTVAKLELNCGVKRGTFRLPAAQTIGS